MELVQAYVDIERARFGDRIEVSFDVDEHLLYCKVLPLTVQPLVENAIRHGVAKKVNGGTVGLTIRRSGDFVEVIVVDDGVGMTGEQLDALRYGSPNGGVGIANLTKRVLHITGGLPVIESEPDKGTKVMFKLPVAF